MPQPHSITALRVTAAEAAKLTPQQKKFNTLVDRIAKQRDVLRDWEAAILAFDQRYVAEVPPLTAQQRTLQWQLLQLIDSRAGIKLAKGDREYLRDLICGLAEDLLADTDDEALAAPIKDIFNRHAGVDYDTEQAEAERESDRIARAMAQDIFGVELGEDEEATPEAVLRRLHEKAQAREAQAAAMDDAAPPQPKRAKKPSARERQAEQDAKEASQSVREIYRKLASALHPDREPDAAERARKTALMQRVNQAYGAGNLLLLLELQLELEHIDTGKIAGLSEERLKHYNRVLNEQWQELKQEVQDTQGHFLYRYDLSPFERHTPTSIGRQITAQVYQLTLINQDMARDLERLSADPAFFKPWLKEGREAMRKAQRAERGYSDLDDYY